MSESPELKIGADRDPGAGALAPACARWLRRRLREDEGAPLVPVSALDKALRRVGSSVRTIAADDPSPGELMVKARRQLFPPARLKSLHRWLRNTHGAEDVEGGDITCARAVQALLRGDGPVRREVGERRVLEEVVVASLERALPRGVLAEVVAYVRGSAWPAQDAKRLAPYERLVRILPVRVAAIDLVSPLRRARAQSGEAPRKTPAAQPQMMLLDAAARPAAGPAWLAHAGREAAADLLGQWARHHAGAEEVRTLARQLRDRFLGGPGSGDAVEALIRASVLELNANCSAAELKRLEAVVASDARDVEPILEYGDYLARALRSAEALRAYLTARDAAGSTLRSRVEERISAREARLDPSENGAADIQQLSFRF